MEKPHYHEIIQPTKELIVALFQGVNQMGSEPEVQIDPLRDLETECLPKYTQEPLWDDMGCYYEK